MLPATVKVTILGWDGSFVGEKRKGVWKASPLCLFGRFGRQGTKLLLRKKSCQSKDLRILWRHFIFLTITFKPIWIHTASPTSPWPFLTISTKGTHLKEAPCPCSRHWRLATSPAQTFNERLPLSSSTYWPENSNPLDIPTFWKNQVEFLLFHRKKQSTGGTFLLSCYATPACNPFLPTSKLSYKLSGQFHPCKTLPLPPISKPDPRRKALTPFQPHYLWSSQLKSWKFLNQH